MKGLLHFLIGTLSKRETPQERSHARYLVTVKQMLYDHYLIRFIHTQAYYLHYSDLNNTIGVIDPTFGLLQNGLVVNGMGTVTDPNCLQVTLAYFTLNVYSNYRS